jgi:hypothetical protein
MLSDFGFFEIIIVAALAFVAWRIYQDKRKFTVEMIIIALVGIYLLYAGVFNSGTSFAD